MKQRDYQRQLEFSDEWLRLGLLSEAELRQLGHEYEVSDDKRTEHYRYRVFSDFLNSQRPLSPSLAEALYELGKGDPDQAMGGAMMRAIVGLTECPAEVLGMASASGEKHLVKAARQRKLLEELNSGLTDDSFVRCLESRDAVVQRQLLARPDLTRRQLEQLVETGGNRAVRNMAAEKLRAGQHAA